MASKGLLITLECFGVFFELLVAKFKLIVMKRSQTFKLKLFCMFTFLLMGASAINSCNSSEYQKVEVTNAK